MNDDEEDRAAILRRRQRLIALALSGLTSAAGCEDPAAHPLVKPERVVESEAAGEDDVIEDEAEPEDAPQIAEAPEPYVVDPVEVQHAEEAKRRWRARHSAPRVCLSLPPPMACLSRIPPRPQPTVCLWKKPVEDDDE